MKVQKIRLSPHQYSWLVLDNHHLPIEPITKFIRYLNHIDKSPYTIRAYAYHLKLYWEFLQGKQLNWQTVTLDHLAAFVGWLKQPKQDIKIIFP